MLIVDFSANDWKILDPSVEEGSSRGSLNKQANFVLISRPSSESPQAEGNGLYSAIFLDRTVRELYCY